MRRPKESYRYDLSQYPEGFPKFIECSFEDMPPAAQKYLEREMQVPTHRKPLAPPTYVDFGEGGRTYAIAFKARYDRDLNPFSAQEAYFADVSTTAKLIGWGVIMLTEREIWLDERTTVATTHTLKEDKRFRPISYQNIGLGTRRLLTMNAASQQYFGSPLYGSKNIVHPAVPHIWQKLEKEGLVINDEGSLRFK